MIKMNKAVALGYNRNEDQAPRILAKGSGPTAEAIMAIADRENIPVVENRILTDSLYGLDVFDYIPENWYDLVAELIVYVFQNTR